MIVVSSLSYARQFYVFPRRMQSVLQEMLKIIVEKHSDGYIAYPIDLEGIVVGEGDTYEGALADVRSAIRFHIETFGREVLGPERR